MAIVARGDTAAVVSVVMPVWSPNPAWLRAAVLSVLAERDCEIELIVVDDGNADPVADLLEAVDDRRLTVLRVRHGGVSAARNAGIAAARGESIRFADCDDVVEPGSTARLLKLGAGRRISYGNTLVCDRDLRPQRVEAESVEGDVLLECVLGGFSVYVTAMLFPREVIEAAGGFDEDFDVNEDYEFLLRALEHGEVCRDDFIATRYRRHSDSATAGDHAGRMMDMLALDRFFERRPDLGGTSVEARARAHLRVVAADQLIASGSFAEAVRHLAAAIRLAPRAVGADAARSLGRIPRSAVRHLLARLRGT